MHAFMHVSSHAPQSLFARYVGVVSWARAVHDGLLCIENATPSLRAHEANMVNRHDIRVPVFVASYFVCLAASHVFYIMYIIIMCATRLCKKVCFSVKDMISLVSEITAVLINT
jgi:hypothetical protein